MEFSADDRVLIKVLRQEKGYGAKNSSHNFPASQIWGKLQSVCIAAGFVTLTSWSHAWLKSGNIHQVFIDDAIRQWRPRLSACTRAHGGHFEHILLLCLIFVQSTLRQLYVCAVAYSGHFCFGGDLTKPSITIASVDRFYLNLVICL